jgi:hypothetical protein
MLGKLILSCLVLYQALLILAENADPISEGEAGTEATFMVSPLSSLVSPSLGLSSHASTLLFPPPCPYLSCLCPSPYSAS